MHPVLKAAIESPRLPRPYGSEPGENGFGHHNVVAVDTFIKRRSVRVERPANDNFEPD
jgi:hypothetical protein